MYQLFIYMYQVPWCNGCMMRWSPVPFRSLTSAQTRQALELHSLRRGQHRLPGTIVVHDAHKEVVCRTLYICSHKRSSHLAPVPTYLSYIAIVFFFVRYFPRSSPISWISMRYRPKKATANNITKQRFADAETRASNLTM